MNNRWLTGAGVAVLTVAGAFAAQAADLPTRKEAPAPVFVPPPFAAKVTSIGTPGWSRSPARETW